MATSTKKTYVKKNKASKNKTSKKEVTVDNTSKEVQNNVETKSIAQDTKYIYPADKSTKLDRKGFRTSARNTFRAFERKIENAETEKDKKALTVEFNKFKKATFVDGIKATIGR